MTGRRGHASTVPGADLATLIAHRHDVLRDHARSARTGDVEGVHRTRVASRRLREAIPILGAGLNGARVDGLGRRLKDLTRALGPVRELDVALGMVDQLTGEDADARRLQVVWRGWLETRRDAPLRRLRKALAPNKRARLDERLDAFEAARAASDDPRWRGALARQLAVRADQLRARIEQTGALYHAEPLHEVRIAAKKLRYALELAAETHLARLARPLRTLKASQDALGRLHDVDVLIHLLRELPDAAPGEELHGAAGEVITRLEHQSRWLHARYLRAQTVLVHLTDAARDTIGPRVLAGPAPRSRARTADHAS